MEKLKSKMDSLQQLKDKLTPEYLRETPLKNLKEEIVAANNTTQLLINQWEATNWEDLPDTQTLGYEGKKQEAMDLRDQIKGLLQPRITELEALEAQSEVVGAKSAATDQAVTIEAKLKELNNIHATIEGDYDTITKQYVLTHPRSTLEPKLKAMEILKDSYLQKHDAIEINSLTHEQSSAIKTQKREVIRYANAVIKGLQTQISKLISEEHEQLIKEHKEAKETAEKTTKEEKDKREKIEKELETEKRKRRDAESSQKSAEENLQQKENQFTEVLRSLTTAIGGIRKDAELGTKDAFKQIQEQVQKSASTISDQPIQGTSSQGTSSQGTNSQGASSQGTSSQLPDTILPINDKNSKLPLGNNLDNNDEEQILGVSMNPNNDEELEQILGAPRTTSSNSVVQLKLDTVSLPYFNGDLTEWSSFRDFYEYLVHKNKNLSDTLKFHQLRTHLRGTAFETIKGYQLIGSNYSAAWEDLKKRYDRKDDLIQEYIRRFLEVPAIFRRPTFNGLRAIVDGTNQMLRALPSLNVEVDNWDPFVNLIIITKLDEETRQEWKQKVGRNTSSTVRQLLDFLETRAVELQPTQGDRLSQLLKNDAIRRQPKKIFQITGKKKENSKLECPVCGGPHRIWNCEKIRSECAKVRTEMIRDLKMCFKCLAKHQFGDCNATDCPYCKGPHNILLCYKKENDEQKLKREKTNRNFQQKGKWHPKPAQEESLPPKENETWN